MGKAKIDSHYKRLQRFLREFNLDQIERCNIKNNIDWVNNSYQRDENLI